MRIIFTVLGAVIGAGFASGREILSFFSYYDPLYSALSFFLLFSLFLSILFFDGGFVGSKYFSAAKPFIYAFDLVLASGMLSAFDEIYSGLVPSAAGFPVLSVAFLVVSVIVVSGGVSGLESANSLLTPVIIVVMAFALIFAGEGDASGEGVPVLKVGAYVGLNIFTSAVLFSDIAKIATIKTKIFSVIISSSVLACLIYFTLVALVGKDQNVVGADIPMLAVSSGNRAFYYVFSAALISGVATTLFSCHYPLYELVKTKKCNYLTQIALAALIFGISRLGFYNIVSFVYPVVGGVGFIYLSVTWILRVVFRSRRPQNTLLRQERKGSPYSS